MASATLHHLVDEEKLVLYRKLREALADEGCLIIGDYFVSEQEADERLQQYQQAIASGVDLSSGKYHFDVPTTVDNEKRLLAAAGFAPVEAIWESANYAIISAWG